MMEYSFQKNLWLLVNFVKFIKNLSAVSNIGKNIARYTSLTKIAGYLFVRKRKSL